MIIVPPLAITDANIVESNIPQTEADYVAGSYDTGERVVFENKVYESLTDANTDAPDVGAVADPVTWLLLGASNPYRIFDGLPSTQSSRTGNIDFTINTGSNIATAIALLNIIGASVQVTVTADGEVVYTNSIDMVDGTNVVDWYTYFYSPIYFRRDVVLLDLPPYPNADVRVLINAGSGVARCGVCLIGNQREIGTTTYGTSVGIRDYSRKEQNQFGDFLITRRGFSKRAEYDVVIDTPAVAYVERELAERRSVAALYVGEATHPESIIYGFYRDFDIVLSNFTQSNCSLSVEGLTYDTADTEFFSAAVNAPFIYTPENGDTAPSNAIIRTEPFTTAPANSDTHASTDWEIATDESFSSIVYSSLADATNLESLPMPALTDSTDYFVRCVHNSSANGASPQSNVVAFTYSAAVASVDQPTMTSPTANEMETLTPTLTTTAYSGTNDEHYATDWQIASDAAFSDVIHDSIGDTANLTSYTVPADTLIDGESYFVRARHVPKFGASSAWSDAVAFSSVLPGELEFTSLGSFSGAIPRGVNTISIAMIGAGQAGNVEQPGQQGANGGDAGGLLWIGDLSVTPDTVIAGTIGQGGQTDGELGSVTRLSYIDGLQRNIQSAGRGFTIDGGATYTESGEYVGGRGGEGGYEPDSDTVIYGGGGGAGGYNAAGGNGGGVKTFFLPFNKRPRLSSTDASPGYGNDAGNGGDGGWGADNLDSPATAYAGGGTGITATGAVYTNGDNTHGGGGINTVNGSGSAVGGGNFGGGGAAAQVSGNETKGGNGAIRIIWGKGKAYPDNTTL